MEMLHHLQPGEPEWEGWYNDASTYSLKAAVATNPKEKKHYEDLANEAKALGDAARARDSKPK